MPAKRKSHQVSPFNPTETIAAPYKFTEAELLRFGKELAGLQKQLGEVELQKKAATEQFKSRMASIESALLETGRKVDDGFELRPTECRVAFDRERKIKSYYRVDLGTFVEERPMTTSDLETLMTAEADGEGAADE